MRSSQPNGWYVNGGDPEGELWKTIAEELVALEDAFQVLNERSPKHTKKKQARKRAAQKKTNCEGEAQRK